MRGRGTQEGRGRQCRRKTRTKASLRNRKHNENDAVGKAREEHDEGVKTEKENKMEEDVTERKTRGEETDEKKAD